MKKGIIIILAVIILIILAVFYITNRNKNNAQTAQTQNISNEFPILPNREYIAVNQGDIKSTIEEQIAKKKTEKNAYAELSFKTKDNKRLALNDFIKAEDIQINGDVLGGLDQLKFQVFSCCTSGSECKSGIIFTVDQSGNGNALIARYKSVDKGLREWEGNLFQNFQNFFFGGSQLDLKTVPQFSPTKFVTKNGANTVEIRYAILKDEFGKNLSIDYAFFDNQIFISNNKDCIRESINQYQDVLEP